MRRPVTGPPTVSAVVLTTLSVGLSVGLALAPAAPAAADHERLPQGRHLKTYTVKPGDTATGLAVRFHAWTAELISHNHLDSSGRLRVGQRIEIPVVTEARDKDRDKGKGGTKGKGGDQGGDKDGHGSGHSSPGSPSRDRVPSG